MYKLKKKEYKIVDDFTIMSLDYIINSESHYIHKKNYKINRTRHSTPDIPDHLRDLLDSDIFEDEEDFDD